MRIILIGPPGVGKGTQSTRLVKHLDIPHLSTGDMLRRAFQDNSEVGRASQEYMSAGKLVPDPIILKLVDQRLEHDDCRRGYLLDGFPRTLGQAQALDAFLAERGTPLNAVVELKVDHDELVKRLAGRGRQDDRPEIVSERLQQYARQTSPLVEYYRKQGLLVVVDGIGTQDEVFHRIQAALARIAQKQRDSA